MSLVLCCQITTLPKLGGYDAAGAHRQCQGGHKHPQCRWNDGGVSQKLTKAVALSCTLEERYTSFRQSQRKKIVLGVKKALSV